MIAFLDRRIQYCTMLTIVTLYSSIMYSAAQVFQQPQQPQQPLDSQGVIDCIALLTINQPRELPCYFDAVLAKPRVGLLREHDKSGGILQKIELRETERLFGNKVRYEYKLLIYDVGKFRDSPTEIAITFDCYRHLVKCISSRWNERVRKDKFRLMNALNEGLIDPQEFNFKNPFPGMWRCNPICGDREENRTINSLSGIDSLFEESLRRRIAALKEEEGIVSSRV